MSSQSGVPVVNEIDLEETDPIIAKLQKTGCLEKHYAVLVGQLNFMQPLNVFINLEQSHSRNVGIIIKIGGSANKKFMTSEIVWSVTKKTKLLQHPSK